MAGQPYGMQAMLKEGHEMHDEPVMKNIVAAKELSNICRSSMGPNGEGRAAPRPLHVASPQGPHPRRGRISLTQTSETYRARHFVFVEDTLFAAALFPAAAASCIGTSTGHVFINALSTAQA